MLDKMQIRAFLEFKMGHKAAQMTNNINNTSDSGTANKYAVKWWLKKFCQGDKSLENEE